MAEVTKLKSWADSLDEKPGNAPYSFIGLVVTVHEPYLKFLPQVIKAWECQTGLVPEKRVLVLDNCELSTEMTFDLFDLDWDVVHTEAGHPSPARNAGLEKLENVEWVIFWDGDNIPDPMFMVQAVSKTQAHPKAGYIGGDKMFDPRDSFSIDTGGVWRTAALHHVGGWKETWLEDWSLGREIQKHGWDLVPLGIRFDVTRHPEQRSLGEQLPNKLVDCSELGVITLLRGDSGLFLTWVSALEAQEFLPRPEQNGLTVVIDCPVWPPGWIERILNAAGGRFGRITFLTNTKVGLEDMKDFFENDPDDFKAIHYHVARLYRMAFLATPEARILTWEDDVEPHSSNAIMQLFKTALPNRRIAGVSAVFPARKQPEKANFSQDFASWSMPELAKIGNEVGVVGQLSGGFTIWSRAALEPETFLGPEVSQAHGWDGWLSIRLTRNRWKLLVDGKVRCNHPPNDT